MNSEYNARMTDIEAKVASSRLRLAASMQELRNQVTNPPIKFDFSALNFASTEVGTPLVAEEAIGDTQLDTQQRAAVIGEVVPIIFCRRVGGTGGVLVSPAATEARFENDLSNQVTALYHLVLGEGPIDAIQNRDVFQVSCRVGTFNQTYNQRAGNWQPGNFIVPRAGYGVPQCPQYCGTSGVYSNLVTLSFSVTYPDGVDQWNKQVHCFVRGGLHVQRLLDNVTGPSNNVADLFLYLLRTSSKVPSEQLDTAGLLVAATFTNVNGFWFNGVIKESTNLRDWCSSTLSYFLLRQGRDLGKEGVYPLLPINANGTIKTTPITWDFTFTEEHIVPGSFAITYSPLADRKPFCVSVLWRQQDDNGIGLIRTTEIRYPGEALDGPFEQHDMSGFCASENHAVKIGTYILSRRRNTTHKLRITVRPDAFNPTLVPGKIVRVLLDRIPSTGPTSVHDYLYQVDTIGKNVSGEVTLDLSHFPVDDTLRSTIALEVTSATGGSVVLPTTRGTVTCDTTSNALGGVRSPSDTSIPTGTNGNFGDLPAAAAFSSTVNRAGNGGGGSTGGDTSNANDGLNNQEDFIAAPLIQTEPEGAVAGLPLTRPEHPSGCYNSTVQWYKNGNPISGATGDTYTPDVRDIGSNITARVTCPDNSIYDSPPVTPFNPVLDFTQYGTVAGTVTIQSFSTTSTTFYQVGNCSQIMSTNSYNSGVSSITRSVSNVLNVRTATKNIYVVGTVPQFLAASITYSFPGCRTSAILKGLPRNGVAVVTTPTGITETSSVFGANVGVLSAYTGYDSYVHGSTITNFVLTGNVNGLGLVGDDVWRKGLAHYIDPANLSPFDTGDTIDNTNDLPDIP